MLQRIGVVKNKTVFVCQSCGAESPKWFGRCTECGEWGSAVEEVRRIPGASAKSRAAADTIQPRQASDVLVADIARRQTRVAEFDRVLGGGLVPGSGILVGGEPGIGKSTLLLQVAGLLAQQGIRALYISGEESESQIAMRARRLGLAESGVYLLSQTDAFAIESCLSQFKPELVVIDSIQTVYNSEFTSPPGSVSQVRDNGSRLVNIAKERGCVLLLVGHITKEGSLAGPKVLEHLVDVVLYMEGERYSSYRILRATKNRFG